MANYANGAVNSGSPSRAAFTYAVPDGMSLCPGDGVLVPFGRQTLQGIVIEVAETAEVASPRLVEARIEDRPVISIAHVALGCWISEYYLAPLFASIALMLPPGFERKPLTFYRSLVTMEEAQRLPVPPRQRAVLSYLIEGGLIEAGLLSKEVRTPGVANALSQLSQRGLVERSY